VYGDIIYHPSGSILGIASIMPESTETLNQVKLEVARVMQESHTIPLSNPSKYIKGAKLDVHEWSRLKELSRKEIRLNRKTFMESLESTMESKAYQDAEEAMKSKMIHVMQNAYDDAARNEMLKESDDLQLRVMQVQKYKAEKMLGKDEASKLFGGL
jgi:hypothetical protein